MASEQAKKQLSEAFDAVRELDQFFQQNLILGHLLWPAMKVEWLKVFVENHDELTTVQRLESVMKIHAIRANVMIARYTVFMMHHRCIEGETTDCEGLVGAMMSVVLPEAYRRAFERCITKYTNDCLKAWHTLVGFILEMVTRVQDRLENLASSVWLYDGPADQPKFTHGELRSQTWRLVNQRMNEISQLGEDLNENSQMEVRHVRLGMNQMMKDLKDGSNRLRKKMDRVIEHVNRLKSKITSAEELKETMQKSEDESSCRPHMSEVVRTQSAVDEFLANARISFDNMTTEFLSRAMQSTKMMKEFEQESKHKLEEISQAIKTQGGGEDLLKVQAEFAQLAEDFKRNPTPEKSQQFNARLDEVNRVIFEKMKHEQKQPTNPVNDDLNQRFNNLQKRIMALETLPLIEKHQGWSTLMKSVVFVASVGAVAFTTIVTSAPEIIEDGFYASM